MAEIILERVAKHYAGGGFALQPTDLAIRDGEFFVLVGPSGCGKSTLLNLIVGLETLSDGEIRVNGQRINEMDPKDRDMAMVFQSYALYPHLSVRENLAFPLRLAKRPEPEIAARVSETAALLELDALLDRKPQRLSGGQRQRVAMGRALIRRPSVFLMDEPLSNLDARLRVQMRAEIARLQKQLGITTVYVTHDQTEAMTLGQQVAVLQDGRLQQVAAPREIYRRPANRFVAEFIGSPGMNFLDGTVDRGRIVLPALGAELPVRQASVQPATLRAGIRPEDLHAAPGPGDVRFSLKVEALEWLGAEAFAQGSPVAGNSGVAGKLTVRLPPDAPVAEGDVIELGFDPARLHLFDQDGGLRLELPLGAW
jgi:multiple sugar transport system ATP-binding protein